MAETQKPSSKPSRAQARLRRSNRTKIIRTILQIAGVVVLVALAVSSIIKSNTEAPAVNRAVNSEGAAYTTTQGNGKQFIALSYPGITTSTSLESRVVNDAVFAEQMQALKDMGYETITQQDILNYYLYYGSLPDKALFIIFEDGLANTTTLAQPILEKLGYIATMATYANNLDEDNELFLSGSLLKTLEGSPNWELGSNGYRLSYINIFDRYNNFFGALNAQEFVKINEYLWRDYNHYLMDFERDADRLRTETEEELVRRLDEDYTSMRARYIETLGFVPRLYILMHSNTGAFGTDAVASDANRENLTDLFAMNFNREGTVLNQLNSSIYDLSRLQVQSYFSTNHLLMRIQDDIGEPMTFVTGDETEAENWYVDQGAAQFKGSEIILTTPPRDTARMTYKTRLFSDVDMTATLQGNLVGRQSISLRTDRNWEHGIEIALEDNILEVVDLSGEGTVLYSQNLFEFDGGPYISMQEDEYNGLVALQQAIIQHDEDPDRVALATQRLMDLATTPVLTLEDGGTPYYPVNDTADRESRKLRIRLVGSRLSLWVDDKPLVDQLKVPGVQIGSLSLGAEVYANTENRFTQHNIHDDVYDSVFTGIEIRDAQNTNTVLYAYRREQNRTINTIISEWFGNVTQFFVDHF